MQYERAIWRLFHTFRVVKGKHQYIIHEMAE